MLLYFCNNFFRIHLTWLKIALNHYFTHTMPQISVMAKNVVFNSAPVAAAIWASLLVLAQVYLDGATLQTMGLCAMRMQIVRVDYAKMDYVIKAKHGYGF